MEESNFTQRVDPVVDPDLDDEATPDVPEVPEEDEPVKANVFDDTKQLDQVAREVIAGNWGAGQAWRNAVADAGYDPNAIRQEIVRIKNDQP